MSDLKSLDGPVGGVDLDSPVRLSVRPTGPLAAPSGRPVRKDEIELADRGLYVESWLPERRSRRKPLLFVHGELGGSWLWERYLGYFAGRGWEGHALNLRNHYWSQTADPTTLDFTTYTDDVIAALERLGSSTVLVGHGMGALLALRAAELAPASGLILLSPEPPREVRGRVGAHALREVPDAYGRAAIGWETLPGRLQRDHRDLTLADVLRIQHLLGQRPRESGEARRQVLRGVAIDAARLAALPKLVIGAGLDRQVAEADAERVAEWLGARYEPFGAHSHYGIVLGERSFQQVADTIRAFLEAERL